MASDGINEELRPLFHQVTDTDRGAFVLLTAVAMVVVAGLVFVVKCFMTLSTFRRPRWDDLALTAAMVKFFESWKRGSC